MNPEEVVEKALGMGAQDAVANLVTGKTVQVKFVNDEVAVSQNWVEEKLEIFLSVDKRLASTTVTKQDGKGVEDVLEKLLSRARVTAPKEDYHGIARGPFKYRRIEGIYDRRILSLEHAEVLEEALEACREAGAARASGVLEAGVFSTSLSTSNEVSAHDEGTFIMLSIRAFSDKGGSGHAVSCARTLRDFRAKEAGTKAGEIAALAADPKAGREGRYRVLFDPLAFAPIVESAGKAASIFAVEAGFSFLPGKLGEKAGNENFTLIDDATLPRGLLSRPFDDEGVPTRRNVIVDKGVLRSHLHNTSTARKYRTATTANAGLLSPRPWNVILSPGGLSREEMLAELGSGLYVTNVWYTRFQNYVTGDFSTVPRDGIFLVRKGEIEGSIRGIRISDNMRRIFGSILGLSKESRQVRSWEVQGSVTSPWVIVEDVRMTKSR